MLECSLATIISNVIQYSTYFLSSCSSFIIYSLSFCVPGLMIGYWGYRNKRIHVLKDSPVLGQADVQQSILIHLCQLMAIVCNAFFFFLSFLLQAEELFFFRCQLLALYFFHRQILILSLKYFYKAFFPLQILNCEIPYLVCLKMKQLLVSHKVTFHTSCVVIRPNMS